MFSECDPWRNWLKQISCFRTNSLQTALSPLHVVAVHCHQGAVCKPSEVVFVVFLCFSCKFCSWSSVGRTHRIIHSEPHAVRLCGLKQGAVEKYVVLLLCGRRWLVPLLVHQPTTANSELLTFNGNHWKASSALSDVFLSDVSPILDKLWTAQVHICIAPLWPPCRLSIDRYLSQRSQRCTAN